MYVCMCITHCDIPTNSTHFVYLSGELFNQYSHLFASYEEYYQKYPNAVK